jgi:hypothetical protein
VVVHCQNVPAGGVCTVQCAQGFTSRAYVCPQQGGLIDVSSFSCSLPGTAKPCGITLYRVSMEVQCHVAACCMRTQHLLSLRHPPSRRPNMQPPMRVSGLVRGRPVRLPLRVHLPEPLGMRQQYVTQAVHAARCSCGTMSSPASVALRLGRYTAHLLRLRLESGPGEPCCAQLEHASVQPPRATA